MATPQQKKKPATVKQTAASIKQTAKEKAVAAAAMVDPTQDIEARRTRLKALILLGKERGYLTFAEINDHLPEMLEVEQVEGVVSMINDMGITVCDVAPDTESLVMNENHSASGRRRCGGRSRSSHLDRGFRVWPHHRPRAHVHARNGRGRIC